MIPADRVHPDALNALMRYLTSEIRYEEAHRRPLEQKWIKWHNAYRAIPEFEVKEFPFLGASNLVLPIIATDVETVFSRIMGLLFAPDNLWSTRPLRPDTVHFASRLQEFLQVVQEREIGAYEAVADWVLELCKLGTGILKTRYNRQQKLVYQFRETPQGIREAVQMMTTHDHPELKHVSLFDFLIPANAESIQDAPWVSERIMLTWQQYLNRVHHGIYFGEPQIRSWFNSRGSRVLEELIRLDTGSLGLGTKLEVRENWLDFDISGQGIPQAIVATIHIPSNTLLRLDYNPFFNQEKPYDSARYMRQEKRFLGIGLAEILDNFQAEITAMHNQRIDSGTIANSGMFKAKRGVVQDDEPVFPGRWFQVDDMDDIATLQFGGQKFDSSVQYEEISLGYATRRSGVNDYMMGSATPSVGYATAMTNMQQFEQTVKRFDQTLREIRRALNGSGQKIVELYQQYNQQGKPFIYLGDDDGAIVQQFLEFPVELARMAVGVDVTATSASMNKEVEIRTNSILSQQLSQYYQQMFEAVMIALNPQLPEPVRMLAMQMVRGLTVLTRRILDAHGVQDTDELIPRVGEVLGGQAAGARPGSIPGAAGQAPQMAGPGGNPMVPAGGGGIQGLLGPGAGNGAGIGAALPFAR